MPICCVCNQTEKSFNFKTGHKEPVKHSKDTQNVLCGSCVPIIIIKQQEIPWEEGIKGVTKETPLLMRTKFPKKKRKKKQPISIRTIEGHKVIIYDKTNIRMGRRRFRSMKQVKGAIKNEKSN